MSILLGIGVVTTLTTLYLGRKGWQAFHRIVGITPGVLTYQPDQPLLPSTKRWQQLSLNKQHVENLSEPQRQQLQSIDKKADHYQNHQAALQKKNTTSTNAMSKNTTPTNIVPALTESQFVLQKMLHIRLPEILDSHYHLATLSTDTNQASSEKRHEADALLQKGLNSIEQRLDDLLEQIERQHLQALRVMDSYISKHDR